jgi:hypothetical protein
MQNIVDESRGRANNFQADIAKLQTENTKLEEQLSYQIQRTKRNKDTQQRLAPSELDRERTLIDLNRLLDSEHVKAKERDQEIDGLRQRIQGLLLLNSKYARQAIELAARVRVYSEHNDKFATLLSLHHDEKIATEKENDLLRAELMDLNKFHQLRDNLEEESGTVTHSIEFRMVRHGFGSTGSVARHLQYTGLMNRITMPKEAALTLCSDIIVQRQAQSHSRLDFPGFIHTYMTRKHGGDAIVWAYSLDEATRVFDSDVNLHMFGLVSRRKLGEVIYSTMRTDIAMFMEGCEAMDIIQHGETNYTVPIAHAIGLLVEMFPGYPDAAFRRMIDNLNATLTTNGHAHYRMLFPNLERDEVATAETTFSAVELRSETVFSASFKELALDDAAVAAQQFEDLLSHHGSDKVSMSDMTAVIQQLFPAEGAAKEVVAAARKVVLEFLGSAGSYEVTLPKQTAINVVRTKTSLRNGVFRTDTAVSSAGRMRSLMSAKGELATAQAENLAPLDYREVLQSIATKRKSFLTPDDDSESSSSSRKESPAPGDGAM